MIIPYPARRAKVLMEKLERALMIFGRVIDQTEGRVILGEKVPASEKVVSFFEVHADIIEKGGGVSRVTVIRSI